MDLLHGRVARDFMHLISVGTANPKTHYAQSDCWEALQASAPFQHLGRRSHAILKKVLLGNNGVSKRYLALDPLTEAFELTPDALHTRFTRSAPALATEAAQAALARIGLSAADIDGLIISTCTGYLCPGLTSYVSEALGLAEETVLLDLVGQGCGAALPNLRAAAGLLERGGCERVLSVCVEVCSAAFFLDEDPGVLISACLFGDGAGAVVTSRDPLPGQRAVEWVDFGTYLCAADREYLRFEQRGGMLRNILAPEVPPKAAAHARRVRDTVLSRAGVAPGAIQQYVTHAGGREVLLALAESLEVPREAFQFSWEVLDECGNLSSPFVFFVLERALAAGAPDGWWWMNSFGAGFSSHGALLRVGQA